jgi:(p)ppGpp synthase/HD superfamily hydrolase
LFYSKKLIEAFAYTMRFHQEHKKMGQPIMSHIFDVVSLVLYFGGDEDTAIAAMLHDTNERATKSILADIKHTFNANIAEIVRACSNAEGVSWRDQKQARIDLVATVDKSALLVLSCEVLSNIKRLLFRLHGAQNKGQVLSYLKTKGGIDGKIWYYRSFCDALRKRKAYPELTYELEVAVRELENLIY